MSDLFLFLVIYHFQLNIYYTYLSIIVVFIYIQILVIAVPHSKLISLYRSLYMLTYYSSPHCTGGSCGIGGSGGLGGNAFSYEVVTYDTDDEGNRIKCTKTETSSGGNKGAQGANGQVGTKGEKGRDGRSGCIQFKVVNSKTGEVNIYDDLFKLQYVSNGGITCPYGIIEPVDGRFTIPSFIILNNGKMISPGVPENDTKYPGGVFLKIESQRDVILDNEEGIAIPSLVPGQNTLVKMPMFLVIIYV